MTTIDNRIEIWLQGDHQNIYSYSELERKVKTLAEGVFNEIVVGGQKLIATLTLGNLSSIDEMTQIVFRGVGLKFPAKVTISTLTPPEDFSSKPIAISKEEILEKLEGKNLRVHEKIPIVLDCGIRVSITINSIGDPEYSQENTYSTTEIEDIECDYLREFFLVSESRPEAAPGVQFEIRIEEGSNYDISQQDEVNWIDISELRRQLDGAAFNGRSIFNIDYKIYRFVIKVLSVTCECEVKPLSSWVIRESTRVNFYISPLLGKALIPHCRSQPLNSIKLFVKPFRSTVKNGTLEVDVKTLKEMIHQRKIPFALKQNFNIYLSDTHSVSVRVDHLGYKDRALSGADYTYLGSIDEDTEIELDSNDKFIILNEEQDANFFGLENLEEAILRCTGLAGLSEEALRVVRSLVYPLGPKKELAEKLGISLPKGVLLYGPPGTGKTTFVNGIAKLLGVPKSRVNRISGTDVHDMWVGNTEKNIRELFKPARSTDKLCIVVIDEMDSLTADRESSGKNYEKRVVTQLLAEMDGLTSAKNVIVFATTNRLKDVDPAFLRDGRFGQQVEFNSPTDQERLSILKLYVEPLREQGILEAGIDLVSFAKRLIKAPGSAIEAFVENAKRACLLRDGDPVVKAEDFEDALKQHLKRCEESGTDYLQMFA